MIDRTFCSENDLIDYLRLNPSQITDNHRRLLERANELIALIVGPSVDSLSIDQKTAVRLAVAAQVEYWLTEGEKIGRTIRSYSTGKVSVTYSDTNRAAAGLGPRAYMYLLHSGVLYGGNVDTVG